MSDATAHIHHMIDGPKGAHTACRINPESGSLYVTFSDGRTFGVDYTLSGQPAAVIGALRLALAEAEMLAEVAVR